MQCARHDFSDNTPRWSRYSIFSILHRSRTASTSCVFSDACVWKRTPSVPAASSYASFISASVHDNTKRGATAYLILLSNELCHFSESSLVDVIEDFVDSLRAGHASFRSIIAFPTNPLVPF